MERISIVNKIQQKKFDPVYLFYGEETFFIDQLVNTFKENAVDPQTEDFNFDMLMADQVDGNTIVNLCTSFPMMAEYRVVIVKSVQKLSTSDKTKLAEYVKSPVNSTLLVLTANKVDKRQKFYSTLIKNSIHFESKKLYENQAVQWVREISREKGIQIDSKGAELLVQQSGTSLWMLYHEIEKLITYCWGMKQISYEDVTAVAGFSRKYNSWELVDSAGKKNFKQAMEILNHMLDEGASAIGLIIQFVQRIILLLRIRSAMEMGYNQAHIAQALKLRPYFAKLYIEQAQHFKIQQLYHGLNCFKEADFQIKTGKAKPVMALTLAVYKFVKF